MSSSGSGFLLFRPVQGGAPQEAAGTSQAQETVTVLGRLKDWARSITGDAHAVYLAARDPRTPWYAKALAICVAAYALSPIELIPDFVPFLGYLDDAVIVPFGIWAVAKLIPLHVMAESRAAAAVAAERPVSFMAAVIIILVWMVAIGLTGWLVYRHVLA
jgi:uncharacterized membrane protein YkvA (DUF1232 family)